MNAKIIEEMAVILEQPVTADTVLKDCDKWDSIAVVGAMAMLDDHGIDADFARLSKCVTVGDIASLS